MGILFALVGGVLALFAGLLFLVLRKRGNPEIPGRSYAQVVLISLVAGVALLSTAALLALPGMPDSAVPKVLGRHLPALSTAIPQLGDDLIGEMPLYASMLWD